MNTQEAPPTAVDVSNYILSLAAKDGKALTPLQIMKLVYIAHGWMLALYQRPLISNRIEAWKYGPVIPDLYHIMKQYGASSVTKPLMPSEDSTGNRNLNAIEQDLVGQVYKLYGNLNGIQLSSLTHQAGTPWEFTWNTRQRNAAISNDLIADHYRRIARERRATT